MAPRARTETLTPRAEVLEAIKGPSDEFVKAVDASYSVLNLNDDIARIEALRAENAFGQFESKLRYPPIEGYAQHWFNDKPGRIDAALRAGWTHVNDRDGKPKKLVVDSGGLIGYLLKIPEQFREEDKAREQAKATAALNAVKKKPDLSGAPVQASDRGAFYTPEGKTDAATITRR